MLGNFFGGRSSAKAPVVSVTSDKYFVGRDGIKQSFARYFDPQNAGRARVFMVHGAPGMGKSTLLRHLRETLSTTTPGCQHATFDFAALRDTTQAWRETLAALRATLGAAGLHFARFDALLAFSVAAERDHVLEPLFCPPLRDAHQLALGALEAYSSGEEALNAFLVEVAERQAEIFPDLESGFLEGENLTARLAALCERAQSHDPALPSEIVDAFAQDFLDFLPPALMVYPDADTVSDSAIRGALFFDGYEELWDDRHAGAMRNERQLDWWMRELCAHCLAGGVLPILFGREPLLWPDDDPDWTRDDIEQHTLGRLNFREAQEFLARCGLGEAPKAAEAPNTTSWADSLLPARGESTDNNLDPLQAAILQCTAATLPGEGAVFAGNSSGRLVSTEYTSEPGCHPLWLALCASIVLQNRAASRRDPAPTQFARIAADQMAERLCELFLRSIGDRALERAIAALSLTPRFDQNAAQTQAADLLRGDDQLDWLGVRGLCIVQSEGDSGPEFLRMHPLVRRALQARLRHEEAAEEHLNLLHYWGERGEAALSWYHTWRIDPAAALTRWRTQHRDALQNDDTPKARALFSLWREIALDESDHELLGDPLWAQTHEAIARALLETTFASPATAYSLALDHLQNAHHGYIHSEYNAQRAEIQNLIALVRHHLLLSEAETALRLGNLERARDSFERAQSYFTQLAFPAEWRRIQTGLGYAHRDMPDDAGTIAMLEIRRDIDTNAWRAVGFLENSLNGLTLAADGPLWGQTHRDLGLLYQSSQRSARMANLRSAISHFQLSLAYFTKESAPELWGETQRALADCLMELRLDDRPRILRQAIACYDAALTFYDPENYPLERAQLFHDVGLAWGELGDVTNDIQSFEVARTAFEAAANDFRALGHHEEAAHAETVAADIAEGLARLRKMQDP